ELIEHGIPKELVDKLTPEPERITKDDVDRAGIIFVAEELHRKDLSRRFPDAASKIFLLNEALPFTHERYGKGVPDGLGVFDGIAETLREHLLRYIVTISVNTPAHEQDMPAAAISPKDAIPQALIGAHGDGSELEYRPVPHANGDLSPDDPRVGMPVTVAHADAEKITRENRNYAPENVPAKTLICHIITDSIVPIGQRDMIQELGQYMAKPEHNYIERIVRLKNDNPADFMQNLRKIITDQKKDNDSKEIEFYVACPSVQNVRDILGDKELGGELKVKALAFEPAKPGVNAVQVEGIMLALRALRKGVDSLRSAYEFLTGEKLSDTPDDIVEFVKKILFTLPPAKIDINEVGDLNKVIEENIKTAA
ncbi:MAG: hypothetical protein PHS37_09575, partial [Candidatus Omnitrophica bacterium]|nr:hypothetical protein [Candidatus Omnitrophota bacterium]